MRSRTFLSLCFLALVACDDAPAGVDRAAATLDESGCLSRPEFLICEVGTETTCKDACGADEVSLTCTAPQPGAAIPEPAGSRGCHVIPVPTPSSVLYYCCPAR